MNVTLTPQLEAIIRQKVDSGQYDDATEVIREALDALEARDRDRFDQLRTKVAEGFASIERGEGIAWTPALMDELEREAEELYHRGEQPDPDVCP